MPDGRGPVPVGTAVVPDVTAPALGGTTPVSGGIPLGRRKRKGGQTKKFKNHTFTIE